LEGGWGIAEAERHNSKLVMAMTLFKRSLFFVIVPHQIMVVARMEINLGEELGTRRLVQQLINDWYLKHVFDRQLV
jgi:hypothetical protein